MNGEGRFLQSFGEKLLGDPVVGDWRSDGGLLTFPGGSVGKPRFTLMVERPDGSARRSLTGGTKAEQPLDPAFSAAGDQIAFSDRDGNLKVIPTAGGTPRKLTDGLLFSPSWAPDASRIVVNGVRPPGNTEGLWLVNVATGATTLLTAQSGALDAVHPQWSPDGTAIAYTKGGAVWTISPNGAGARPITPAVGAYEVAWAPDSTTLAFGTTNGAGTRGSIFRVGRDGTGLRELYRGPQPSLEDWVTGTLSAPKPTLRLVVAKLVKGVVKVKRPGEKFSRVLIRGAHSTIPYRSQVDARKGRVRITGRGRGRRTHKADFSGGRFKILRRGSRTVISIGAGKVEVRRSGHGRAVTVRKGKSYLLGLK